MHVGFWNVQHLGVGTETDKIHLLRSGLEAIVTQAKADHYLILCEVYDAVKDLNLEALELHEIIEGPLISVCCDADNGSCLHSNSHLRYLVLHWSNKKERYACIPKANIKFKTLGSARELLHISILESDMSIYGYHADSGYQNKHRPEHMAALLQILADDVMIGNNIICVGDFNQEPHSTMSILNELYMNATMMLGNDHLTKESLKELTAYHDDIIHIDTVRGWQREFRSIQNLSLIHI
jgi:hypothetical protein